MSLYTGNSAPQQPMAPQQATMAPQQGGYQQQLAHALTSPAPAQGTAFSPQSAIQMMQLYRQMQAAQPTPQIFGSEGGLGVGSFAQNGGLT